MEGILKVISEKTGKTKEDLENELLEEFNGLKDMPYENDEERKEAAFSSLVATYRPLLATGGNIERVLVTSIPNRRDMVAKRRKLAIEAYDENPEKAVANVPLSSGGYRTPLVTIEGELICPLYSAPSKDIEAMEDWQRNQRFTKTEDGKHFIGKKIPANDYQRDCIGIIEDNGVQKPWTHQLKGNLATAVDIPRNIWIDLAMRRKNTSTDSLIKTSMTGNFDVKVQKEATDDEILAYYKRMPLVKLNDLEEWSKKHPFGTGVFNATVNDFIPSSGESSTNTVLIEDESMGFLDSAGNVIPPVTCRVPKDIPLSFPKRHKIWLIGSAMIEHKTRTDYSGNEIKSVQKTIFVSGIFVPEAIRNIYKKPKAITDTEEREKWSK